MPPKPKPTDKTPSSPELAGDIELGTPPLLSAAAIDGAMQIDTDNEGLDYGLRARLEALLNGGFSEDDARRKLGILPSISPTTELPLVPTTHKPARTGHVRVWSDHTESGRDGALRHDAIDDPNQPKFDAAVNAAGAAVVRAEIVHPESTEPPVLSKANKRARLDLLELKRENKLLFVPSTNKEKNTLKRMLRGRSATLIDASLGGKHIDSIKSGIYKKAHKAAKPIEVADEEAKRAERSALNEMVDHLENAREVFTALMAVRNTLRNKNCKYNKPDEKMPLVKMMADALATNNLEYQAKIWLGIASIVQFRDITRLRDDAIEPQFEPLRTKENATLAFGDANKRIIDIYTTPQETSDEMVDYIFEEAKKITLAELGPMIENPLTNQFYRGNFWRAQAEARLEEDDSLMVIVRKQKRYNSRL